MLQQIHPKLPMRDKAVTRTFYVEKLGFQDIGQVDYPGYLMLRRDAVEIHFFEFRDLNPLENYGQVYIRTDAIHDLYGAVQERGLPMPKGEHLHLKPWNQWEFSLLDPDHNLLTFGQAL